MEALANLLSSHFHSFEGLSVLSLALASELLIQTELRRFLRFPGENVGLSSDCSNQKHGLILALIHLWEPLDFYLSGKLGHSLTSCEVNPPNSGQTRHF